MRPYSALKASAAKNMWDLCEKAMHTHTILSITRCKPRRTRNARPYIGTVRHNTASAKQMEC